MLSISGTICIKFIINCSVFICFRFLLIILNVVIILPSLALFLRRNSNEFIGCEYESKHISKRLFESIIGVLISKLF